MFCHFVGWKYLQEIHRSLIMMIFSSTDTGINLLLTFGISTDYWLRKLLKVQDFNFFFDFVVTVKRRLLALIVHFNFLLENCVFGSNRLSPVKEQIKIWTRPIAVKCWDQHWGSGLRIGTEDRDWGSGLEIGIEDYDWGLVNVLRISTEDKDWGL